MQNGAAPECNRRRNFKPSATECSAEAFHSRQRDRRCARRWRHVGQRLELVVAYVDAGNLNVFEYRSNVLRRSRTTAFHVEYQGQLATFDFLKLRRTRSANARRLVREWARLHMNFRTGKLKALQPLRQIAPLEQETMTILPQVIEAQYVSGYCIELLQYLERPLTSRIDLRPVFRPEMQSSKVRRGGTVCWPNEYCAGTLSVRGVSKRAA